MMLRKPLAIVLVILVSINPISMMDIMASDGTSSRSPGADVWVEQVIKMSPNFPKVGEVVTLNATLRNVGDMNATNVTITVQAINTSAGQTVDIGTYFLGNDRGEENITDGPSNNPVYFTFYWNTSLTGFEVLEGLIYNISVTANNATDDNQTNGTAYTEFDFAPPDRPEPYVKDLTVSPMNVTLGEFVNLNATFKNSGALPVIEEPVFFYVDYSRTPSDVDIFNTSMNITDLYNFGEVYLEYDWNTSGYSIGNHTVTVVVPSTDSNITSLNITIDPIPQPPGKPDLTVIDVGVNRSSVLQGEDIHLSVTIMNVGDELSIPSLVNVSDLMSPYSVEIDLPAFAPWDEKIIDAVIETAKLSIGVHTLQVWVDKPSQNEEWNEANNTKTLTIIVNSKPDLSVAAPLFYLGSTITPITESFQGDLLTILAPVRNIGLNSSRNGTRVSFYLDGATDPFGSKTLLPYTPGARFNVTYVWDTSLVLAGTHNVTVVVDPDDINEELQEDNNMAVSNLTILEVPRPPDLTITGLSLGKAMITAGDILSINMTIVNQGEGLAEDIGLLVTLESSNGVRILTINETEVPYMSGNFMQPMGLLWTLTDDLNPGEYMIVVSIDNTNQIMETDETNNIKNVPVKVEKKEIPFIDIIIIGIDMDPERPKEGQMMDIAVTLVNIGTKDAKDLVVRIFINDEKKADIEVSLVKKGNGTVTVTLNHTFKDPGLRKVRASVLDTGTVLYSMSVDVDVKAVEDPSTLPSSTIILILAGLLVVLIIVGILAGRRRPGFVKDDDIEDFEDDEVIQDEEDEDISEE